jgi:hypothetical protein
MNITCEYVSHYPEILKDIDVVKKGPGEYNLTGYTPTFERDGTLFFNTWFASDNDIFQHNGVSIDTVYLIFQKVIRTYLGVEISNDYWSFFPEIDYSKVQTKGINSFIKEHKERKILVSNCDGLSGQSCNFNMSPLIEHLANKHKDTSFLVTNDNGTVPKLSNVFLTSSIIGPVPVCDLNENAYLSTFCDIILGRYSGAYTISITRKNYQRNVKMLPFCSGGGYSFINTLPIQPTAQIIQCKAENTEQSIDFLKDFV